MKVRLILDKSWLCPLLVCEQDKVGSKKGSVLPSKVGIKGLGGGKKRLQHNIVDLFLDSPTDEDEAFTMNGHKYTHRHKRETNTATLLNKKKTPQIACAIILHKPNGNRGLVSCMLKQIK